MWPGYTFTTGALDSPFYDRSNLFEVNKHIYRIHNQYNQRRGSHAFRSEHSIMLLITLADAMKWATIHEQVE